MSAIHSQSVHARGSNLSPPNLSPPNLSPPNLSTPNLSIRRLVAAGRLAKEPESAWEAKGFGELVPPATLAEARARRDDLARLLRREREAAADFLLALADFDRRRGWERLGHASLFSFLTRELGLSNSAAWYRQAAARVLPRHPAVEAALRDGRLCLSVVGDLSRVLTAQNEAEVLPRFLGMSSRDAKAVVAAILPCPSPPRRDAVTVLQPVAREVASTGARVEGDTGLPDSAARPAAASASPVPVTERAPRGAHSPAPDDAQPAAGDAGLLAPAHATPVGPAPAPSAPAAPLLAPEVAPTRPAREVRDEVQPLTADLRRLSTTVSARFLRKLAAARDGLSHAQPRATTEQVLEAALDLLLEKQARRKALVKRPRAVTTGPNLSPAMTADQATTTDQGTITDQATTPHSDNDSNLRRIPAAVEREVRLRDGDRCTFPLDSGGLCGSTWQTELDHIVPLALGGLTTAANLRCACRVHNGHAAVRALGPAVMEAGRRRRHRRRAVRS